MVSEDGVTSDTACLLHAIDFSETECESQMELYSLQTEVEFQMELYSLQTEATSQMELYSLRSALHLTRGPNITGGWWHLNQGGWACGNSRGRVSV